MRFVVGAWVLLWAAVAAAATVDLPHRRGRITADADLSDWRAGALSVGFRTPSPAPPVGNSGRFRLVWDRHHLWFAAEVRDAEVYAPPPEMTGAGLYQWDSIEFYVDGGGEAASAMDQNDFQYIISCDGRYAVLQGDPLLKLESWRVPKRLQPGVSILCAARRTEQGYIVEGALPWAAMGVADPAEGTEIGLDLAWNDWTEDHPRLPELLKDLENLMLLSRTDSEAEVELVDPDSVGWHGLLEWEERAYRPWSWCSSEDFGRPSLWRRVRLAGGAPRLEAMVERWGAGRLLAIALSVLLIGALATDLIQRRRHRRNIRALVERIEVLEAGAPEAEEGSLLQKIEGRRGSGSSPDTLDRLLSLVRGRMDASLTVNDLAAELGVSPRTLQRATRDGLGATPHDVILAVKMRHARALLRGGGVRVAEVAEQVGFDSPYHFSRRFKDFFGSPPSSHLPGRGGGSGA